MPIQFKTITPSAVKLAIRNFDKSEVWFFFTREEKQIEQRANLLTSLLGELTGISFFKDWFNLEKYAFLINPQEISEEFSFSTIIQPTLKTPYVQSVGVQLGTLNISGKFSFQVKSLFDLNFVFSMLGIPAFGWGGDIYSLAKISAFAGNIPVISSITDNILTIFGFAQIVKFRAFMHRFAVMRSEGRNVNMYCMEKKNRFLFRIEPNTFTISRSSSSPFAYSYSANFTIVDELEFVEKDVDKIVNFVRGLVGGIKGALQLANGGIKRNINRFKSHFKL